VTADPAGARVRLEAARRHLRSAARVADDDPDAAYALLYDAARKAVTAHMLAAGLRPRNAPGAHEATARYAAAALPGPAPRELDRMRRFRNRIEYGTTYFSAHQVAHDLEHARAIVAVVETSGRDWPAT
jgi:HEPN domain